ncbi:hypothetical protein Tco_1323364, partial [Tanacetum coccineum]
GNNAEASGSAFRQAQQIELAFGQDGSGGSGDGAVIGLSVTAGEGGALVQVVQVFPVKVHPIVDRQREEYKQK